MTRRRCVICWDLKICLLHLSDKKVTHCFKIAVHSLPHQQCNLLCLRHQSRFGRFRQQLLWIRCVLFQFLTAIRIMQNVHFKLTQCVVVTETHIQTNVLQDSLDAIKVGSLGDVLRQRLCQHNNTFRHQHLPHGPLNLHHAHTTAYQDNITLLFSLCQLQLFVQVLLRSQWTKLNCVEWETDLLCLRCCCVVVF